MNSYVHAYCVKGIHFASVSVSTICLLLDFGTVPTVWYFIFFITFFVVNE